MDTSATAKNDNLLRYLERYLVARRLGLGALHQYDRGPVGKVFLRPVASALLRLSEDFTRQRQSLAEASPGDYWGDTRRLAYLFHFLPRNYVKAAWVLAELGSHAGVVEALAGKSRFTILDIGCGPGASALATLSFLAALHPSAFQVRVILVEASPVALQEANELLQQAANWLNAARHQTLTLHLTTHLGDAKNTSKYPSHAAADFLWLSNVLNECAEEEASVSWVRQLVGRLAVDGSLCVIEPALRSTARVAMQLRDALLEDCPEWGIFAPCTANGPCRMLAERPERDWCHVALTWKPTPLVAQLDSLTGLCSRVQKFFYFVLRRDGKRAAEARPGWTPWRVIGDLQREKGLEKRLVCGPDRCTLLTRFRRDRHAGNEAFSMAKRGDILWLSSAPALLADGLRLLPHIQVECQPVTLPTVE
jgi:SAM-dependent methyltransferase|uniref:Methyltransferase type 12 n=1 Tax=Chloracidobacterium thermophilum TaxID=458033 RepID=A8DJN6_9BACT|nr:methyltransferase type 12 [Chloracidobacterium thermophilum]